LGKTLIITEKPSVAQDIAAVLGGFEEHEGYVESSAYVVTFAVGHLYELLPPEDLDPKYKRWTLDTLPILPEQFRYKPKAGHTDRLRTIKKLLHREDVDAVVNACDAGREGELIFQEIVEQLEGAKPVRRLWLQSMTEDAIRDGFANLRPGEELRGLAAAAHCRARSDWLIGMNATRALTKRLKSRKEKTAWSAGRVQTPTLAMLVERELEILAHVPRPYWRVTATFEHASQPYAATWFDPAFAPGADEEARDDRLFDEARAQAITERARGHAGAASETRKPSRESAPPLFDLTSLQREANRRFGWSARRTLSAAQRCYERHKVLTYPRTDSRCLPSDYRPTVARVLEALSGAAAVGDGFEDYAAAASRLRTNGLRNEERVFDNRGVSDHFAIIPTGKLAGEPLAGDDRRIFDLVVRRFLGAFHPPALWERVERTTEVQGENFRTRARFLKEAGWRSVLPGSAEEERDSELPALVPGRDEASGVRVETRGAELESEQTKPLPRISEGRLLSLMENAGSQIEDEDHAAVLHEKGIGTPATRADIIENLISKGYVVRQDKSIRPAVKGIRLIDTLRRIQADRLTSPALTGEIEYHLVQVEHGQRSEADFMNEIRDYACEIVEKARSFEYGDLYDANEVFGPCPRCGGPVIEMAWFYRCREVEGRAPEEECPMRFWKDTSGRYLDKGSIRALLRDGKTGPLDGFTARSGRTYRAALEVDREAWQVRVKSLGWNEGEGVSDEPEYEVNPEPVARCPFDEDCSVVETSKQFVCERALKHEERAREGAAADAAPPQTCRFVLPRTVCKREITREEAMAYCRDKRTPLLTDFTSRFGRPFSATLVLKENGRHGFEFQPREPRAGRRGPAAEPAAGETRAPTTRRVGPRKAAAARAAKAPKAPKTPKAARARKAPARRKGASSGDDA
jgi:DNA topoisomerase-3